MLDARAGLILLTSITAETMGYHFTLCNHTAGAQPFQQVAIKCSTCANADVTTAQNHLRLVHSQYARGQATQADLLAAQTHDTNAAAMLVSALSHEKYANGG